MVREQRSHASLNKLNYALLYFRYRTSSMDNSSKSSEAKQKSKKLSKDKLDKVSGGRTGEYMDDVERKQNDKGVSTPRKEI
ncbi:hypothetical protein EAW55_10690 [Legionella jordanis]|nr:hypothetical protein EAW55_10690 [Legionella jordanis]